MKINYALVSRALIALLFVVAGIQKIMGFEGTTGFIGRLTGTSGMIATILVVLVIIVEIPVALAFTWGYRICLTGMILIGFTIIATILAHNPWAASIEPAAFKGVMSAALKNIAIIGGILSAILMCGCGKCLMGKGCKECGSHKK